jgi:aminoglycoside phosphotransferase family enzyme
VSFLGSTAAFPPSDGQVEVRETHMSFVFLVGDRVYKLKKPVTYPFLDFSTVELRHFHCEEELRLNRRLAASTYLAVRPLRQTQAGELTLSGSGRVVDWLVEMKRLPEDRILKRLIVDGKVTSREMDDLAEMLLAFYETGLASPVDGGPYLDHLAHEQAINRQILLRSELGLESESKEILQAFDKEINSILPEIEARAKRGLFVEGHGDLRPEHICLCEPIQIFDCLEFNPAFRVLDPYDELNYLGIECAIVGADWIRPRLLDLAEDRIGNRPGMRLTAFYGAFRSLLRARLCAARLLEPTVLRRARWKPLARLYLAAARQDVLTFQYPRDR